MSVKGSEILLLKIGVYPSFFLPREEISLLGRRKRPHNRDKFESYLCEYVIWRPPENVFELLQRSKTLKDFEARLPAGVTSESRILELDTAFAQTLLLSLQSAALSPFPEQFSLGLDGTTYKLSLSRLSYLSADFTWWEAPPPQWRILGEVLHQLLDYVRQELADDPTLSMRPT